MATQIEICNSALIKIGAPRISAITDNVKGALLCNEQYDKCRKAVLRAHPWNFAMVRAALAQSATAPEWGYTYSYPLPADCLKVYKLEYNNTEYKVEGRAIVTDDDSLNIIYISDCEDTTLFDPIFAEALSCLLAREIGYSITGSKEVTIAMDALYQARLKEARGMDAMEGTPDSFHDDTWLQARY